LIYFVTETLEAGGDSINPPLSVLSQPGKDTKLPDCAVKTSHEVQNGKYS